MYNAWIQGRVCWSPPPDDEQSTLFETCREKYFFSRTNIFSELLYRGVQVSLSDLTFFFNFCDLLKAFSISITHSFLSSFCFTLHTKTENTPK